MLQLPLITEIEPPMIPQCRVFPEIFTMNIFLTLFIVTFILFLVSFLFKKTRMLRIVLFSIALSFLFVHLYIMYLAIPNEGRFLPFKTRYCM